MGIAGVSFLTLLVFRVNFNEIVIVIVICHSGTHSESHCLTYSRRNGDGDVGD